MKENGNKTADKLMIAGCITALAAFAFAILPSVSAQAGASISPKVITSGRPLSEVVMRLREYCAKPVTYEDPIWMWEGDIAPSPVARGLYPRDRALSLPVGLKFGQDESLDAAMLGRILEAYHYQTDGPRFRIISSHYGLHILPAQARNSKGQWISVSPLLDTRITVPVASRRPYLHVSAICDALTKSSGIKVMAGAHWLDQFFGPNGLIPPRTRELTEEEERQTSIPWGAENMVARDALISLIELSATTLIWGVRCSPEPWDRHCVLNLNPIQIFIEGPDGQLFGKYRIHDRIKVPLIQMPAEKPPK